MKCCGKRHKNVKNHIWSLKFMMKWCKKNHFKIFFEAVGIPPNGVSTKTCFTKTREKQKQCLTPPWNKKMAMEHPPFEDVFPCISYWKTVIFQLAMLSFGTVSSSSHPSRPLRLVIVSTSPGRRFASVLVCEISDRKHCFFFCETDLVTDTY